MVHFELITALIRLLVQRVNIKVNVIAADTAKIQDGLIQSQRADGVLHHIIPAAKHSRCGQAEHREVQTIFALAFQIIAKEPVICTEVTAPAGNSVGFVHHKQADSTVTQQSFQRGGQQHFRCNVQDGLFALMDGIQTFFPLLMGHIGIEKCSAMHTAGFQLTDLILHQSDQRSDNDGHRLMHLCQIDARHLIECRLTCTGGSGQEHIGVILIAIQRQLALLDDGADDLALTDLLRFRSCCRVFVEVQHTEIGICAPVLLEDSPVTVDGFRFHPLLMFGTVQCKGHAALCRHKRQHIIGVVLCVLLPLHRQYHRAIQFIAEELVCQHQRRNLVGQRCRCIRKNRLLFLIERNAADVFALMPVEQCHIVALIQRTNSRIVMAENFR